MGQVFLEFTFNTNNVLTMNKKYLVHLLRFALPLVLFLAFGPNTSAQTMMSASTMEASTSWKNPTAAMQTLNDRIQAINLQMPGFAVGSQPYENAFRRVAYYKAIMDALEDGQTISAALESSMDAAATLGNTKEVAYTSKVVLRALYDETRILLTN
jgi:hypothetical protein